METYNYNSFVEKIKSLEFDVYISSSSFEERCFIISKLINGVNIKKSIFYYNNNEVSEIVSNAKILLDNSKNDVEGVILNSDDPIHNYVRIIDSLLKEIDRFENPRLLIDSTTFTHETLLILIRVLEILKSKIGEVYIAYLGAGEYSTNIKNNEEKWLSKGIKEIRTILGYPGYTDPILKNHLMIMFGFEYNRTKQLIDEYEFDMISIGFGDEPIDDEHLKINYERHLKLLELYSNAREFKFSLINPLDTKKQILNYIEQESFNNYNTVIAPLNNKISTIGAGLAALENSNIQLTYAKPQIYNTDGYSTPGNIIYLDKINV